MKSGGVASGLKVFGADRTGTALSRSMAFTSPLRQTTILSSFRSVHTRPDLCMHLGDPCICVAEGNGSGQLEHEKIWGS